MKVKYRVTSGSVIDRAHYLDMATYWPVGVPFHPCFKHREIAYGRREIWVTVDPDHWSGLLRIARAEGGGQ